VSQHDDQRSPQGSAFSHYREQVVGGNGHNGRVLRSVGPGGTAESIAPAATGLAGSPGVGV